MNKTILKWAGSKAKVMAQLNQYLPAGARLVEPFAGSCAVMMNTDYPAYLIADINPDLINLYQQVKEFEKPFTALVAGIFAQNGSEEDYRRIRNEFNHEASLPLLYRAAYFLYLNRHGYRGLCRYNRKGDFNTPYEKQAKPHLPVDEIRAFAAKAQRATFICADFTETLAQVQAGDVVYCDPPYHGTFADYHSGSFADDEQCSLVCYLLGIADRNPVVLSNSDTLFTRSILRDFTITKINTSRSIGVAAGEKKRAAEIIAVRNPVAGKAWFGIDSASKPVNSAILEGMQ